MHFSRLVFPAIDPIENFSTSAEKKKKILTYFMGSFWHGQVVEEIWRTDLAVVMQERCKLSPKIDDFFAFFRSHG